MRVGVFSEHSVEYYIECNANYIEYVGCWIQKIVQGHLNASTCCIMLWR